MSKEKRIKKERERLAALFADLDENQLQTAAGLISSAAFLRVTLEDLEEDINADGCIDEYTNGANQCGYKVAANVQAYTSLNAKYQSTMQKLLKIVPPAPKKTREKSALEVMADEEKRADEESRFRKLERQKRCEEDFFNALAKGEASQAAYKEFCAAWSKAHPE